MYPFAGSIPLDPVLTQYLEEGKSFIDLFPESSTRLAVMNIVQSLLNRENQS